MAFPASLKFAQGLLYPEFGYLPFVRSIEITHNDFSGFVPPALVHRINEPPEDMTVASTNATGGSTPLSSLFSRSVELMNEDGNPKLEWAPMLKEHCSYPMFLVERESIDALESLPAHEEAWRSQILLQVRVRATEGPMRCRGVLRGGVPQVHDSENMKRN